jgi:hypothetical protein
LPDGVLITQGWMAWLERDQRRLWLVSGLGYLLLCWLAFFQNLGSLSLMDKTEALFVEVGRQMVERGGLDHPDLEWRILLRLPRLGVLDGGPQLPPLRCE